MSRKITKKEKDAFNQVASQSRIAHTDKNLHMIIEVLKPKRRTKKITVPVTVLEQPETIITVPVTVLKRRTRKITVPVTVK